MIRKIIKELGTLIIGFFSFCCMVILLGAQTLLQGSWRVPERENNKEVL